jgi:hypothetical protein
MPLDDLVKVTISAATATPSKPGFGTILIAAQKVPAGFVSRFRKFSSLKEMTDFGFSVNDPAYRAFQKAKAQDPAVSSCIIGKRLNKTTQTVTLTLTSAVEGDTYAIKVVSNAGVETEYTRTVPGSSSTTAEATALAALIDAHAQVSAAAVGAVITVTGTLGELVNFKEWTDNIQFKDTTADPGLADDLAAIQAATNVDWYGLALDSNSEAQVGVAALFVETEKKIACFTTSDYGCMDSGTTTDVMSDLKTAAYARSGVLMSKKELHSYSGIAWMAKQFAGAKPGEDTWAYKTLASVTADEFTGAERTAILDKNGNLYSAVSSINVTEKGKTGSGEYFDIVRFIDWLKAEIQFRVFSALINNKKIPYTDLGIDAIVSIIKGALKAGEDAGGLEPGTSTVTAPKVKDIASATRATRKLSDVKFGGKLAGAIHELEIDGSLVP